MSPFARPDPVKDALLKNVSSTFELVGMSPREAKKQAREMVQRCEQNVGPAVATSKGDKILDRVSRGDPKALAFVKARRAEGVTDADIRWYWNMTDLEKCVLEEVGNLHRAAMFLSEMESAGDAERASAKARKFHAMYGEPEDTTHSSGEDRPLFPELKDRVDKYVERWQTEPEEFKGVVEKYSSFNALIRAALRAGQL